MNSEFLKSWADNIAALSDGRVSADDLHTAAITALDEGKDLNDPTIRRALIAEATPAPSPTL